VGFCNTDPCRSKVRIGSGGAAVKVARLLEADGRFAIERVARAQKQIVGFGRWSVLHGVERGESCAELLAEFFENRGGELILQGKKILGIGVEPLRPHLIAVGGLRELNGEANFI
jgi:hypothetical protein